MKTYHKIQTVFKRDPATKHKTLLEGEYSLPEFEYLANNEWVFTEKVDGTNIRIICQDGKLSFGGKTDNAQIPAPLYQHLSNKFLPMAELAKETLGENFCLYGEGYGGKIQKAGETYGAEQRFVLFDIFIDDLWLQRSSVEGIADRLGIPIVPILGSGTLPEMVELARAGIKSTWGDFQAEGYVARTATEMKTRRGDRMITKIKCRDFQ